MKQIFGILFCLSIFLSPRAEKRRAADSVNQGISFVQGLNWAKMVKKAKRENKFIFIDCYATWCGPCKMMDRQVYALQKVGDFCNDKFVCVKMQMDGTTNRPESAMNINQDVKSIADAYHINAYPTLLFFDPDGHLLRKTAGAISADEFIALAKEVLNPDKNYYRLLGKFKEGHLDTHQLGSLAIAALSLMDTTNSKVVADAYVRRLEKEDSITREDVGIVQQLTLSSKDIGFRLFYEHSDSLDRIMDDSAYSQGIVAQIVLKELMSNEIATLKDGVEPDWVAIERQLEGKYHRYYAERTIIAARVSWAGQHKDWDEWSKWYVLYEDTYGNKTVSDVWAAYHLNSVAWAVFTYSNNNEALTHALSWSGRAVLMDPDPNYMDTYANILYRLGRKTLALQWESSAAQLGPDNKEIQTRIAKMKNGEATWAGQN
jgi:thioredoxin-related protein